MASPLSHGSLPAACTTTGALPAPPIEGAGFGPTPACPHGAPAAPSRFRYVVEHQPTARVRTLAEPAGGSEERRVGKECRSRGAPDHLKKKRRSRWAARQ